MRDYICLVIIIILFSCGKSDCIEDHISLFSSRRMIYLSEQDTIQVDGSYWHLSSNQTWLTFIPNSGNGKCIVTIKADRNKEWRERDASVLLKNKNEKISLFITQKAKDPIPDDRVEIEKDNKRVVKVISVYEDPLINGKRLHQYFPSSDYLWFDPHDLNRKYKEALEECSGGVIEYEVVKEIDAINFFTKKEDGSSMIHTAYDLYQKLVTVEGGPGNYRNSILVQTKTRYDYRAMIEFYGFDKMRDNEDVSEIWLWSYPGSGCWESTYAGKDAWELNPMWNDEGQGLWLNSWPVQGVKNQKLLVIMGLNYERNLACAMESYGHRVESVMWQVYGRLDRKNENPNNFELYTRYDYEMPNQANIGNIHYTATGTKDYEWANSRTVLSFANAWKYYPDIRMINPEWITCTAWNCSHESYMRYWFSHLPNRKGINSKDGKFNNWWRYFTNYSEAYRAQHQVE